MEDNLEEGPVPAHVMEEIFIIAEQVLQEELQQQAELQQVSQPEMTGLEIGYFAPSEDSQELGEPYYIRKGKFPPVKDLPEDEEEEIETDPAENLLSDEFIDQLIVRLEAEIIERTPQDVLTGYSLHAFVAGAYGFNDNNECCYGSWCCIKDNGERGRQRYRCDCSVTPCRGRC